MKKLTSILFILTLLISLSVNAQKKAKPFTGVISFNISFEGRELEPNEKAQMPTEIKTYYGKDNLIRTDQISAMGSVSSISNTATNESTVLFDMMGQKMAVKSTKKEYDESVKDLKYDVTYTDDTKTILGYKCKKAIVKDKDGKEMTVYYTQDINVNNPNANNPAFKDIKGVALEYTQPTADEDLTLHLTAKEVKKSKVKKSMFTIPAGYKTITKEEFKSMIGG